MNFSAVILAGGKSSRMGRDKAFVEIDGRTLLARQIETARAAGAVEILISGRANTYYSAYGLPVLHDQFSESGPLAGIHAALRAASQPLLLALAVDLPDMTPDFLRLLTTRCANGIGVVPRLAGQIEPLAAFYPRAARELAETALREDNCAVCCFAKLSVNAGLAVYEDVPPPLAHLFHNCNSPDQLPVTGASRA